MDNWTLEGDIFAMNLDVVCPHGRIAMIDCENEGLTDAKIEANGRLIAAAPDLLAALEMLTGIMSATLDLDDNATDTDGEQWQSVLDARAAINKAKGI